MVQQSRSAEPFHTNYQGVATPMDFIVIFLLQAQFFMTMIEFTKLVIIFFASLPFATLLGWWFATEAPISVISRSETTWQSVTPVLSPF